MPSSHLCHRCGGWHAVGGPCPGQAAPEAAFGLRPAPGALPPPAPGALPPLQGRPVLIQAQAEADAAEAAAIATYRLRFRTGGAY